MSALNKYLLAQERYKKKGLYRKLKKYKRIAYNARKWGELNRATLGAGTQASLAQMGATWDIAKAAGKADPRYLYRKATQYYGPGDYKDILKWGSRGIGGLAGAATGYMQGGFGGLSGGAKAGWDQGAAFSKFMGWGDYSANQIVDGGSGSQQNISVNQSDLTGDIWVTRTEFVQNVIASGTAGTTSSFQPVSFALNPGLAVSFPFLSQIANNFELYEFHGLMYQYKPLFSENAGTANNLGKVIFATNYDPNATTYINSIQMENADYANSTKPSDGLIHGVETKNNQQFGNMQYVRSGASARDKIFTDIGTLWIANEGVPLPAGVSNMIIGELWVTYSVKLSRAQLFNSLLGFGCIQDVVKGTSSAAATISTITLTKSTNQIGIGFSSIGATSFTLNFPANISLGSFFILVRWTSGATVFTTQAGASVSALTNLQVFIPGTQVVSSTPNAMAGPLAPVGTTSNTSIMMCTWVQVQAPGLAVASITFNVSAALTNTTTFEIHVMQCNSNAGVSTT